MTILSIATSHPEADITLIEKGDTLTMSVKSIDPTTGLKTVPCVDITLTGTGAIQLCDYLWRWLDERGYDMQYNASPKEDFD